MQCFAHGGGRGGDAAAVMQAIGAEHVDGQCGAHAGHQHRRVATRTQQRQEAIHAEAARVGIGDADAGAFGGGPHDAHLRKALLQAGDHALRQCRRGHAGDIRNTPGWQRRQRRRVHRLGAMRPCLHLAGTVAVQRRVLEARISQVEQPLAHAGLTLTSPEWNRRTVSPSCTRNAPSAARPSATPVCRLPASSTCTARPLKTSRSA